MKARIFILLLLGCGYLWAQTVPDSSAWYAPWQQRLQQATSMEEYQAIRHEFEKQYRNQPMKLLRLYDLYEDNLNKALMRNLKTVKTDLKRRELINKYGYANKKRWEDFVLAVADVAAQIDTIPDMRLRDYARVMQEAAKRIRFFRGLKNGDVPDFRFTDLQGEMHHFHEFKGRYVLLFFWNRHSKPCVDELPYLKKAQQAYPQKLQIVDVYISFLKDPMEKEIVLNLFKEMHLNWPHIFGPQSKTIKEQFFVLTFPTILLFDPQQHLLNELLDPKGAFQNEKLLPTLKKYIPTQ